MGEACTDFRWIPAQSDRLQQEVGKVIRMIVETTGTGVLGVQHRLITFGRGRMR